MVFHLERKQQKTKQNKDAADKHYQKGRLCDF